MPMPLESDAAPALELNDVRRSFRTGKRVVAALDGITATARRGAVTGLIGPVDGGQDPRKDGAAKFSGMKFGG